MDKENGVFVIDDFVTDQDLAARSEIGYWKELSTLEQLRKGFPSIEGRDFSEWLKDVGEEGNARVLEFGGGTKQVAAKSILKTVPGITRFTGYEIRPIDKETGDELSRYNQYHNIQGGLNEFDSLMVGETGFDIAFAHNVAEHLPHPFLLLKRLHASLKKGGLLFVNGITLYRESVEDLFSSWNDKKQTFQYGYASEKVDRNMIRSGINSVNIGLRKTSEDLPLPSPKNERLRDFSGRLLPSFAYSSGSSRQGISIRI